MPHAAFVPVLEEDVSVNRHAAERGVVTLPSENAKTEPVSVTLQVSAEVETMSALALVLLIQSFVVRMGLSAHRALKKKK